MVRSDGFESDFGIVHTDQENNPKAGLEAIRPHHVPLWATDCPTMRSAATHTVEW